MPNVTYDSIKADQAWMAITDHLQRRNQMLADGVHFLERQATNAGLASRLVVLQYHLRATVRRLVNETASFKPSADPSQPVKRQWQIVHQLQFLVRQIDDELQKTGAQNQSFRQWMDRRHRVLAYKPTPMMYLN